MKTFYKVFLVLFVIFIGINLYAVQWHLGAFSEENDKSWYSIAAAVVGIIIVFIMDSWSRLSLKKS